MCLPIAVAPGSLWVLFAAPFKERLKAHLICKAPQFTKSPPSPSTLLGKGAIPATVEPLLGLGPWGENSTLAAALAEPSGDAGRGQKGLVIIFLCLH